jgi:hypothetical protein
MEPFYLIVLAIATIVLILLLTFIGLMMKKQNTSDVFPPVANTCPDGWTYDAVSNACLFGQDNYGYNSAGTAYVKTDAYKVFDNLRDNSANIIYRVDATNAGIKGFKLDPVNGAPIWNTGGLTSLCSQKSWANKNQLLWDGVSNYNSC